MQLILDYPLWFLLFCVLAGAIGSFGLYWKNRHFTEDAGLNKYLQWGMAALRFLSITTLSFLLLSPFIKSRFVDKIDPVVVYVHDNTSSVLLGFNEIDSNAYLTNTNATLEKIADRYQIDYFTFDNELRSGDTLDFTGKQTNLSNVLEELQDLYFNRNVGAVIFASDGIYNEGYNPYYTNFNFPIYTIALGDSTAQKDLKIANVRNNKIAYLDDKVKVEVDLESYGCNGSKYAIELFKVSGKKTSRIAQKSLSIKTDYAEQSASFTISASSIGIQKYQARVSVLDNEITVNNNVRDFYIDVIDSRQKILVVANSPHPDLSTLKQVVEENKNYEIKIQYVNQFNAELDKYNLVILHQIPSKTEAGSNVITAVKKAKLPIWFITGQSSNYTGFNQHQNIVKITQSANTTNDAGAYFNTGFSAFTLQETTISKLKKFPPLAVPFGDYQNGAGSNNLLYQKIGAVETAFPLLSFEESFGVKSAVLIGDGLWRWRMHDFLDNKSHDAFDELMQKTINYLALKADKRKFRTSLANNIYYEGEMITLEGALYNESYELVNEPEASLVITDEEGAEFPFTFSKTNQAYVLKTNALPIGNYKYLAKTKYNGKSYQSQGAFSINALQLEALQTKANHNLLKQLSNKTGGESFYPNDISSLENTLLVKDKMNASLYETYKTRSIINLKWIFFLIMGLLSVEWFMRKYLGGY